MQTETKLKLTKTQRKEGVRDKNEIDIRNKWKG